MSARTSQDVVLARCMALLARLLRGPATSDELFHIVAAYDDPNEAYGSSTINKRLEKDRDRLKAWFGCEWELDRRTKTYMLIAVNNPLFDLPDDALRGLAFLQFTFSGSNVPMSREVIALFNALQRAIPPERRAELEKQRDHIEINLNPRDDNPISNEVLNAVRHATMSNQQLEFVYQSPARKADSQVTHCVEPNRYFFEKGHYYLEAFCLQTNSTEHGVHYPKQFSLYRLGHMSQAKVLPKRFIPGLHSPRHYELTYQLVPEIARRGVTKYFEDCSIEPQSDGSAIVRAVSTMLFVDLRTLLHYGPGCRVLGGDEALKQMKALVVGMYKNYEFD